MTVRGFMHRGSTNGRPYFKKAYLVVLIPVILIMLGVVWRLGQSRQFSKDSAGTNNLSGDKKTKQACESRNTDICRFLGSWRSTDHYQVISKDSTEGVISESAIKVAPPNRYQISYLGKHPYQLIIIGSSSYLLDASDNTWWEQTLPASKTDQFTATFNEHFANPATNTPTEQQINYKKIAKEACGTQTCLKYQVTDPRAKQETHYIWFDTALYRLRRSTTISTTGSSDQTFSYDTIDIKKPARTKAVPEGSTIAPGSSQPVSASNTDEQTYPDNSSSTGND